MEQLIFNNQISHVPYSLYNFDLVMLKFELFECIKTNLLTANFGEFNELLEGVYKFMKIILFEE
jgi:hypothetical protein